MIDFIINFFVVVLILVSLFAILVVLMQRNSTQAGMGAALGGGGAAEQAFGAETGNVLTRATQTTTIIFFVLAFGLYLAFQARYVAPGEGGEGLLPDALSMEEVADDENGTETDVAPAEADESAGEGEPVPDTTVGDSGAGSSEPNP